MRTHYKIILAVSSALLALAGCKEPEKYLRTTPAAVEIAADILEVPITVEATASWMGYIPSTVEWLERYRYDGDVVWIRVTGTNTSLEARATEITIISGDGLTVVVPFTQLAMDAGLDVAPATLEPFDAQGKTTQTLTVETKNLDAWEFTKRESWLLVAQGEGEEAGVLTIATEPSRELDPRRDTIIISPVNDAYAALADTIPVVQNGLKLLVVSQEYMNEETYVLELPAEGVEMALTVNAWDVWTVSAEGDTEGRASLNLTGGGADLEEGVALVLTLSGNTSPEEYAFTLVFECAGETYEYRAVQAAAVVVEPEPDPEPEP